MPGEVLAFDESQVVLADVMAFSLARFHIQLRLAKACQRHFTLWLVP